MSQIRSRGTKPEKLLKKALWGAGFRYKSPKKPLPGKPDISLKKYKLVILVDGAFWHGYKWENRKHAFKSNREFWIAKIERNMQRDQEVNANY
jgi:DNA mismatch endonuclease (patch repair protein)